MASIDSSEVIQDLLARVDRLEALDQIRQLPPKYALSLDQRDIDALVNLFVEDVGVGGGQRGRPALKRWYVEVMRRLKGTAHNPGAHVIDIETPDLASGVVYSRNDKEHEEVWEIELMLYFDRYERRDGVWYFQRRAPLYWYQMPLLEPVLGDERKLRMGDEPREGAYHQVFPTWSEFWADLEYGEAPVRVPAPAHQFISDLRRGEGFPRPRT
ncbi:MAG: nuclear transport factor 2 family protein [Acidobacteria bacterium]|nr:nuclear transport factor 2 family protein [Acidobacteriota bacterium]